MPRIIHEMCGIAGLIGKADQARIERMVACLDHRGPDDRGVWRHADVALGHTRLAIIDLSPAGHQPMESGDLVITYNGEIYNYRKLRAGLPGPFHSHSDTEVLLHLYREYGERCVERLEGMFAFAIWDRRARKLFAARDALGIKPFVYRAEPDAFAFASEVRALVTEGKRPLEKSALRDYFAYGYIPSPKTIYSGIAKLPPAHTLTWQDGKLELKRYWMPSAEIRIRDAATAREALDATLKEVIPEQTVSDVPVGVFLSSGIDSATVSAYAGPLLAFTLGFDRESRSEVEGASQLARHLALEHRIATAARVDLAEALRTLSRVFDEPHGDSADWSNYKVCQLARPYVTVALSGEGGDELFCGYPRYWQPVGAGSNMTTRSLGRLLPPLSRAGQSMQRRAARGFEGYAAALGQLSPRQVAALVHQDYLEPEDDPWWLYRKFWRDDLHPTQLMRWLDLNTGLPEGLLVKADRSSMAHSLEVRPPLLDRRLVQLAMSLHPQLLVMPGRQRGKEALRELIAPKLPAGYLDRPKSGFGLPVHRWAVAHRALVRAAVTRLRDAGILKRPVSADFRRIWSVLALDAWLTANG